MNKSFPDNINVNSRIIFTLFPILSVKFDFYLEHFYRFLVTRVVTDNKYQTLNNLHLSLL